MPISNGLLFDAPPEITTQLSTDTETTTQKTTNLGLEEQNENFEEDTTENFLEDTSDFDSFEEPNISNDYVEIEDVTESNIISEEILSKGENYIINN